ncbi:MAG: DUF1801 domain-containing protein [Bacteroidota bacterium]
MSEPKTRPNSNSVQLYCESITNEKRKSEFQIILNKLENVCQEKAVMWGPSIVGYGRFNLTYKSGKVRDWMLLGASNRKQAITVYFQSEFSHFNQELEKLGEYKTGKCCLYIKSLDDINLDVFVEMAQKQVKLLEKDRI